MEQERIPDNVLADNFHDGDEWNAAVLNNVLAIFIKAINQNYKDIVSKTTTPGPQGSEGMRGPAGDSSTDSILIIRPTAPINPFDGMVWIDSNTNNAYIYANESWNPMKINTSDVTGLVDALNNMQGDIDSKTQTFYQESDPSIAWTDENKIQHVGDIWCKISTKESHIYTKTDEGNFYWDDISVPLSLYDTLDGKKTIYTSKPDKYNKSDIWILEDDEVHVPNVKGEILVASVNNIAYNPADWLSDIKYAPIVTVNAINEDLSITKSSLTAVKETVDGVSNTIVENTIKTLENSNDVILLKNRTTTVENAISGITTTLKETGGLNLLIDSVFYFGGENWEGSDFVGYTNTDISDNTKSKNAIYTQNRTWSQTIQVKNGTYTLSGIYKKLVADASVLIVVNGEILTLDSLDWGFLVRSFVVTNRNIKVEIISDTLNSAYISDLMLNSGDSIQVWGLNQNETYTDNVQIGKGIKITATGTDTELNAASDAIRIKKKSTGDTITDFTDKGVKTKDLEAETAKVSRLLIQNINGQVCMNNIGGV